MNLRYGTKEDVLKIRDELKGLWLMHVDNEPKFINKDIICKSDLKDYFKDCFNGSGKAHLLIAEIDNNIAGFTKVKIDQLQNFFNQDKVLYVDDIYTIKNFRNKGVSTFLLKQAEKLAKDKDIKWLKARIYSFNKPAQAAFLSAGYKNLYSEYFKII